MLIYKLKTDEKKLKTCQDKQPHLPSNFTLGHNLFHAMIFVMEKSEQVISQATPTVESKRIRFNTAEPPIEVMTIIKQENLLENLIGGWVAVPSINPPPERLPQREIQVDGKVDAFKLMEPFLGNRVLDQTLRTIDVLNGCGHHCDVCLADAALPSRMFSFDSFKRLFQDKRFLYMLQPDSVRFGSSGDILDHPRGVEIVEIVLEATKPLDEERMKKEGKHHRVKVFTNYRPNLGEQLDKLIEIAKKNPDRFDLTISLPFNKKDSINAKFMDYIEARPELFAGVTERGEDGLLREASKTLLKNVGIQDVRHPRLLFVYGRIMSKEANAGRVSEWDMVGGDSEFSFRDRGFVKTFLNPDALWLMIYATTYESHTERVFTPLTVSNLEAFSHLPWHYDFPKPPNWPGKMRERTSAEAQVMKAQTKARGYKPRPYTIVS